VLALVIGNLVLNNLSALAMGSVSIVFLGSFLRGLRQERQQGDDEMDFLQQQSSE
jgi:hypothetical protein